MTEKFIYHLKAIYACNVSQPKGLGVTPILSLSDTFWRVLEGCILLQALLSLCNLANIKANKHQTSGHSTLTLAQKGEQICHIGFAKTDWNPGVQGETR